MRASIHQSIVSLHFKSSEIDRANKIMEIMCSEIRSMCIMETHDIEAHLCYSPDEITVVDTKKSYSDAKKATK